MTTEVIERQATSIEPEVRGRVIHVTTVPETLSFLRGQADHFRSRGFEITAVSSPGPALDAFARQEGVAARGVPMARSVTPLADLLSIVRLWIIFREFRPDVVHGHTPKGGLLAMIAAFLAGVPRRIYTVHGLPLETATGPQRFLLRWTERVSCGLAHVVHAVSESLAAKVRAERLCDADKLRVLGRGTVNGVDAARVFAPNPETLESGRDLRRLLGIPPEAPVIGFAGRIVRDKGVGDLVAAWSSLREELPELHLLVAGSFEPRDPVPEDVRMALELDPRVHLAGQVEIMPAVYAASDVIVLPTRREGFPQVPLEAAAMELPVVATSVTGCVDAVVDWVTGRLVPPGDADALACAIRAYLWNPELRLRHGRAGRERVLREFRPERLWKELEREYRPAAAVPASDAGRGRPPAGRPVERAIKRLLDVAGAVAGLVLGAPILMLVALGTRLTLGRPVFFRQVRPGLNGRPFTPLKFRTMRSGPGSDDERMTRFGRLLRHFSLDELPQLWNVLCGDMSLVGPRPLLMEYLALYSPREARRHDVKPGITGWCQVNGRNSLAWDQKFELDVWYVEHWSLLLDIKILFMTLARVVRRSGVEGPGNRCWPGFLGGGPVFPGTETTPYSGER